MAGGRARKVPDMVQQMHRSRMGGGRARVFAVLPTPVVFPRCSLKLATKPYIISTGAVPRHSPCQYRAPCSMIAFTSVPGTA
eukprot:3417671-Rhodomonas_salina.2